MSQNIGQLVFFRALRGFPRAGIVVSRGDPGHVPPLTGPEGREPGDHLLWRRQPWHPLWGWLYVHAGWHSIFLVPDRRGRAVGGQMHGCCPRHCMQTTASPSISGT